MPKIYCEKYKDHCGYPQSLQGLVTELKRDHYFDTGVLMSGEQPKNFLKVYEYGVCRKSIPNKWTSYIAKFGSKLYPIESITEHLITRIGQILGVNMAESRLALVGGQLRFMSKYFLNASDQRLVHGAEVYSTFLNDKEFVEQVQNEMLTRDLFTYEFTISSIRGVFPEHEDELCHAYTTMLLFDAVVGINDRHYGNWAVVTSLTGKHPPYFSPLFDSSRGLFWNNTEAQIVATAGHQQDSFVGNYSRKSCPLISTEDKNQVNHFELVEKICHLFPENKSICRKFAAEGNLNRILDVIDTEFYGLISPSRRDLIEKLLRKRFLQILRLSY